jgi:hypothetical protein
MEIEKENGLFKVTHDNGNSCIGGLADMIHILCAKFKYQLPDLVAELVQIIVEEKEKEREEKYKESRKKLEEFRERKKNTIREILFLLTK